MANKKSYTNLFKNSTILGAGAFLSKLIIFLLLPLYSSVMSDAEYGIADLVAQSSNLLFPIVTLGICQGVFRFAFGKKKDQSAVFTTGLVMLFAGMAFFTLISPLLAQISKISEYVLLLGMYVFMFALNTLCGSFVRGLGRVKEFALRGVICTVFTVIFNLIFLLWFKLGVVGYLLANICADFVTVLYMFWVCKLLDYIELRKMSKALTVEMLKFSVPLIPTTICWWIVNMSDRFMITYMVSDGANGIYAMAYKVPNLMIVVTGVFVDAWQMSLVNEENKGRKWGAFFTHIFDGFKSVMFVGAAFIILFARLIAALLYKNAFYEAWRYMPFLVIACAFEGIVSFLAVIYIVKKKSVNSLICAGIGAAVNLILNFILIKTMSAMGAAIATMVSYIAVYFITTYLSRGLVGYKVKLPFLLINFGLLLLQSVLTVTEAPYNIVFSIVITAVILIINFKSVFRTAKDLLAKRRNGKNKDSENTEDKENDSERTAEAAENE